MSASHARKAPSSARHPVATKRDLPGCQNALANGRCPPRRRFSIVTHRKAPAANSPRNNAAGCRHQEEQPESKSKRPLQEIRLGVTAGVEPRRHQARGKASGCQDSARDTMVFIAGAAITQQYGNAVGSNAELASFAGFEATRYQ